MFENEQFARLIAEGKPSGEVVAIKELLTIIRGLEGAAINSLIMFENGDRGMVRSVKDSLVEVLTFAAHGSKLGSLAVLEREVLQTAVGEGLIGRVVNVLGEPLDGKGSIATSAEAPVFATAPGIIERQALDKQLVTGVAIVDSLFPFVLGQRIAVLGDNKSGKSTFMRQLTQQQAGEDGRIIIYVLIAKRQVDVDTLIAELNETGAIQHAIIVVASSFDALSQSYLAPYVANAMGEYLWKAGRHVIIIYDDLTNHAKVYREISLLAEVSPGRDSYPGDMFYAHSSLLERAGKLKDGGGTFSAIPVILTPNDDITAYLSTSIMSITDGQIIFDLQSFRKGVRPAVNVGLSVSRVGGRVQNKDWKKLSGQLFRKLADYRQAAEFSQFGSELSPEAQADLALGRQLYEVYKQLPRELFDINTQYLMLATAMAGAGKVSLNVVLLKQEAQKRAAEMAPDADPAPLVQQLLQLATVQVAK
ncbi:MAG TPA: sodium-transporting two-sector ATPase [Candidatus Saccharimonadia bacterium]